MIKLSEQACLEAIQQTQYFHAVVENAFEVKIENYGFFICTAIHDGHQLRDELSEKCQLTAEQRLQQEDPYTGEMIASLPITLIALDSLFEYDLNQSTETCLHQQTVAGETLWTTALTESQTQTSIAKHQMFYRVLAQIIKKIETLHGNCLVYDIHAYNYLSSDPALAPALTPATFNISTKQINAKRWAPVVEHWDKSLTKINLPNIDTHTAIDETITEHNYLPQYVAEQFNNTLVLHTEVKKVYMNETTGELYSLVLNDLKAEFKDVILSNALYFAKQHKPKTPSIKTKMLSSKIEPAVLELDKKLYKLARGIETLGYINPKNLVREKKRFFARNYNYTPEFTYRQLEINPFEFREKLYRLPENNITDISIQQMYRDVIDAYATKIDLLTAIGSEKFMYNSLIYYGEPSDDDIQMAKFLLFAKPFNPIQPATLDAEAAKTQFLRALDIYKIHCKVEITNKIVASAMVDNTKKTILINKSLKMNQMEMDALIHHELGVHMVTTTNANLQKLKIFKLGLPGNTYTQEGLAILAEYMSGNMSLPRLKTLALRVIAVKMMIDHHDFSHTFKALTNDYGIDKDNAFRLTVRVYRGGGFTKDFLYLRGIKDALKLYHSAPLDALYVGKTGFSYLKTINEMIERGMVDKPEYLPLYLHNKTQAPANIILDYLIQNSH